MISDFGRLLFPIGTLFSTSTYHYIFRITKYQVFLVIQIKNFLAHENLLLFHSQFSSAGVLADCFHKLFSVCRDFLPMLGTAYVKFFYHNPVYFDFLFSRKNIRINLSLDCAGEKEPLPLKILKQAAMQTFSKVDMPEPVIQNKIIAM